MKEIRWELILMPLVSIVLVHNFFVRCIAQYSADPTLSQLINTGS